MDQPRVLVSGASGTVSKALLPSLAASGYEVIRLTRGPASSKDQISWDPAKPLPAGLVDGFEAVIHLAGESIIGRWTEAKKRRIIASRSLGTRHLAQALAQASQRPRVLISASAIGYYGNRGDEVLREESSIGEGFTAEICRQWEAATQPAVDAGIRTVQLRISVVLSHDGGAVNEMLVPFRLGLGGKMGSGRQWWSWIHVKDLVGAIHHILKNDLHGPVNACSPNPVSNAEFTKALASAVHRPAIFPIPAFVVRTIFGQMGDELWLASQRVEPAKLKASGYQFQYPEIRQAMQDVVKG